MKKTIITMIICALVFGITSAGIHTEMSKYVANENNTSTDQTIISNNSDVITNDIEEVTQVSCSFCEHLKSCKDLDADFKQSSQRSNKEDYEKKYSAALVAESYFRDEYTGSTKYCGYTLNYCPECGTRIMD